MFSRLLIFSLISTVIIGFTTFAFGATLVPDEVETLKEIGNTLGKEWDFSVDPCSGNSGWVTQTVPLTGFENNVTCDCNYFINGTDTAVCHVTGIILKSQNLNGTLPTSLVRLPYIQQLDLTNNYLNGTIPSEWGSTNLVDVSLMGNRLTGPIPKEFGNISTLKSLVVEINQLSGVLPPELGNLPKIERLFLSSNKFTGKLNETFARLTTMKEFRISDNRFTGKIPDFITKWTNLTRLVMHASGMDGPIPSEIGLLEKLDQLRISDINGSETPFPQLDTMRSLTVLVLRSCNIVGQLPDYLRLMTKLYILDLSFNKLHGEIPSSYSVLRDVTYIFLTGNLLNGDVPTWIIEQGNNIDLSYNNFTEPNLGTCQHRTVNLFGSSLKGNISGISCLRNHVCSPSLSYSFHINCGGNRVREGDITYEEDTNADGPSTFHESIGSNWGFSSTGFSPDNSYTLTTNSSLPINKSQLYMDARLSPLSLTYYGFCLANGNYTVNLHFAEIKFTNDSTFLSLGRRIFDVYIQGMLVLKDFNIEVAAGGVGKKIIISNTTTVTKNTLEIRFHWAGKGTTAIPIRERGAYGPLISAISVVNPDYKPPESHSISAGAVVGIVAAVAVAVLLVLGILWWKGCLRREELDNELRGLDLQTGSFTLRQIKAATNNFDIANKIGEGGFGSVYKGLLSDGVIIAVKQLSSKSKQGNREFVNEIGMISALQHPHLVKLYGCCIEGNQLLLVYEYMENNCLARALFGQEESQLILDWPTRLKICVGIARGLAYLHEESRLKIVHRDIKATNVLLDKNLNPKISDFGLAKLDEEDNTHISTRIAGTYGYMAPEYAMRGYLTDKADVYSFGIVALEIASGRSNTSFQSKTDSFCLLDWALELKQQGRLMELVDPKLGNDYNQKEMMVTINVALLCTQVSPAVRPSMSSVVSMLEGKATVKEIALDPSLSYDGMNFNPMEDQYEHSQERDLIGSQVHSDDVWTGSSASAADLYPINLNSDFLQGRTF